MQILIELAGAVIAMCALGFGVAGLIAKHLPFSSAQLIAVLGYVLVQLIFFPAYFLTGTVEGGVLAAVAGVAMLGLYRFWHCRRDLPTCLGGLAFNHRERVWPAIILAVAVVAMAAWPYLVSGWGNYWHSGNEDIMDALYGRDAYVSGQAAQGQASQYGGISRDVSWDALLLRGGVVSEKELSASHYITGADRLQYSSVAFWSVVLNAYHGMDAFLIQALLNLLLMTQGVYLLGRMILGLSGGWAVLAAGGAVLSNFYLTTYFNGHEGSMIFNSLAPFMLAAALKWLDEWRWKWEWLVLFGLWLVFLLNTYPYPLPYLVLPLASYVVYLWMQRHGYWGRLKGYFQIVSPAGVAVPNWRRIAAWTLAVLALAALFAFAAWQVLEPVRLRAASQFRSWGTMFNYVGLFQYWGIWPSSLASGHSYLHQLIQSDVVVALSALISATLIALTFFGFYRMARDGLAFFPIWLVIWLLLFPAMRFIVADSYYLYKFLYINAFIGVLALVYGCRALLKGRKVLPRILVVLSLLAWISTNLVNDGIGGWLLTKRPYNQAYERYLEPLQIKPEILAQTFIDIPRADHGDVLRQSISSRGLRVETDKTRAKFLLRMEGVDDIVTEAVQPTPIWRSAMFYLIPAPAANMVHVAAYWEPEAVDMYLAHPRRQPFRWVSDGRNGAVDILIERQNNAGRYLHFCAEPGPSVDYRSFVLHARDAAGKSLGDYAISGFSCHWVDLGAPGGFNGPVTFTHDLVGRLVSPIEPRKLVYRISNVGVSADRFDLRTLSAIAGQADIIPGESLAALHQGKAIGQGMLFLGNGWHDFERAMDDSFRWVADGAELIVVPSQEKGPSFDLDVEPGPSLGGKPLLIMIEGEDGQRLGSAQLEGRGKISIKLPADKPGKRLLRLRVVDSPNLPVPNDARILNFRVISISQSAKP